MGRGDSRSEGRRLRESDSRCTLDRESRRLGDVGLLDDMVSEVEDMVCGCRMGCATAQEQSVQGDVQAKKSEDACGGSAAVLDKRDSARRGKKCLL